MCYYRKASRNPPIYGWDESDFVVENTKCFWLKTIMFGVDKSIIHEYILHTCSNEHMCFLN